MANARLNLPTRWLIAAAIVAGIVAGGAFGLYVMGDPSGNNGPQTTASSADDAACAAKQDLATVAGAAARGEVAAMLAASPPQSLKGLSFNAPDGTPMTLADLSGRTVLLNLWATWCAPCREEMPSLDRLQRELGSETFEVVALAVDRTGREAARKFLDSIGVTSLKLYADPTTRAGSALKAIGMPTTILIDPEGREIGRLPGPAEWDTADAKALIAGAIAAPAASN